MKTAKLTLMFLACAAASTAFAQNTTDSRCGITNYDSSRNVFVIKNPTPDTVNQQCFITVISKQSWTGGVLDLSTSQLVEGNYEVTLSGGGGGGGGGAEHAGGGGGGAGAIPFTTVRYLQPGNYRLTIGSGGLGGAAHGRDGRDGAPTSLSNANSGETLAGFSGAESWGGGNSAKYAAASSGGLPNGGDGGRIAANSNAQDGGKLTAVGYSGEPGKGGNDPTGHKMRHEVAGGGGGGASLGNGGNGDSSTADGKMKTGAMGGTGGAGGGGGAGGKGVADAGAPGGNGFIKLALKDPVPQAMPAISSSQTITSPAPEATRPARKDRN